MSNEYNINKPKEFDYVVASNEYKEQSEKCNCFVILVSPQRNKNSATLQ